MGKDFVVEYYLQPNKVSFNKAARAVAAESSIGTWTKVHTLTKSIEKRLGPEIICSNKKTGILKISYPKELFEENNVPQLLSSIAGNIFGMNSVKNLRLLDIDFPASFIRSFKGPRFGIKGIRKLFKVKKRPLLGSIIKPKMGLNESNHAKVAFQAFVGGCDLIKDDENLTNMRFNHFAKRLKKTLKAADKAEKITGERKQYLPNITAPFNEMLKRAKLVGKEDGNYAMVDVISVGWSALQSLRDANLQLVLHGHRAGHAAFTRSEKHGISMLVIAKLCRLIGLDQVHVGAIVGKMTGGKEEVQAIGEEVENRIIQAEREEHVLAENWLHIKPMFAVCSGGLHPRKVPPLIKAMGSNIVIQAGGAIAGHKLGVSAGAKAMRQAIVAVLEGTSFRDYAKSHKELKTALEQWGD